MIFLFVVVANHRAIGDLTSIKPHVDYALAGRSVQRFREPNDRCCYTQVLDVLRFPFDAG